MELKHKGRLHASKITFGLFFRLTATTRALKENIDGKYIGFKTTPIVVILVKYIY